MDILLILQEYLSPLFIPPTVSTSHPLLHQKVAYAPDLSKSSMTALCSSQRGGGGFGFSAATHSSAVVLNQTCWCVDGMSLLRWNKDFLCEEWKNIGRNLKSTYKCSVIEWIGPFWLNCEGLERFGLAFYVIKPIHTDH